MKSAKEIYPNAFVSSKYDYPYDYQPMLSEIGNILIQVDDDDCQGDSRLIFEKDGRFGYLDFGWGSCSGCDALQSCSNIQEVQDLFDGLMNDVKWFDSLDDLKTYFREKDWALDYSYHREEGKRFIEMVINFEPEQAQTT